ncbi:MAG: ABC transporter ATP-binding protein, partial [Bacillota bacterium]|nr:ABC transporter ATP-binding protein [Bacillota bacterium]
MLKINNMKVKYNNTTIIEDISFKIKENTITTLIGPNGCGKSTILKTITKSKKPLSGEIYLNNKNIYSIKEKDLAQLMTILPQSPKVPEDFTVRDLVEYGRFPHSSFMSRLSKRDHQIIDWAIESTKIENLQHRKIETLSGGERQRAWIAMALAQEPRLLLLDEPTTYLDICHQFEILELIKRLNREMGITVVMVLHDINQAARYSDKIIAIKNKKIYTEGEPRQIITEKLLEDVFNIRSKIYEDKDNNCPYFLPIKNKYI